MEKNAEKLRRIGRRFQGVILDVTVFFSVLSVSLW